jgi:hypothetical protein
MATHRYISTTFWDDEWIQALDPSEKYLYLYLMTNPLTSISGIYKITDRRISFDTGYNTDTVKAIMEKFAAAKKAVRMGEYVVLPSWPKHQNWKTKADIKKGILNELNRLKDDELRFVYESGYRFPMGEILEQRKIEIEKETNETKTGEGGDIEGGSWWDEGGLNPPQTGDGGDTNPPILFNSILSNFNINSIGISNVDPNPDDCGQPVNNQPPPNFYKIIKEKVKAAGFYIDEPVARKIAKAVTDQEWFTQHHSIIDFVAEKIRSIYSEKPEGERKKLFISALTAWDNIKDEYPDWLDVQIKTDERKALERLRNTPPKACPHCGADMNGTECPECQGSVWFDKEKRVWQYRELFEFPVGKAFSENLKQRNQNQGQAPPKPEDIDF